MFFLLDKIEGVKTNMNTFEQYKDLFRAHLMDSIVGESTLTLRQFMFQLINLHEQDYRTINYAFLAVRKEIIGS